MPLLAIAFSASCIGVPSPEVHVSDEFGWTEWDYQIARRTTGGDRVQLRVYFRPAPEYGYAEDALLLTQYKVDSDLTETMVHTQSCSMSTDPSSDDFDAMRRWSRENDTSVDVGRGDIGYVACYFADLGDEIESRVTDMWLVPE